MVYGVDECRVCGKPIPHRGPEALAQYKASLTDRRQPMTERQWRAKGFKAAPTRRQMENPHEGCCYECQFPTALVRKTSPLTLMLGVGGVTLAVLLMIFFIGWQFN